MGRLCPVRTEKARTCYGARTKGSRGRLHTALQAARGQAAVVVARVEQVDRWGVVVAWAGSSKRVDMSQSTLSEVQLAGTAHPGGLYMARRLVLKALWLWGVMENASGQAQKPERAVGFGLPRGSVCVAVQI